MNKNIPLFVVFVFLTAPFIIMILPVWASADSWTKKAPMQVARGGLGAAVVNGKIYAIGGSIQGFEQPWFLQPFNSLGVVGTNEEYDPVVDKWTFKAPMPTPRVAFGIAVYQGKIYCMGGIANYSALSVNEVYDPANDTWQTKASVPEAGVMQLSVLNEKIYVVSPGATFVYDPTADSFTQKTAMPISEDYGFASTVFDGKIYVLGGVDPQTLGSFPNQIYDPATDNWSTGSKPTFAVFGRVASATTKAFAVRQIYLIGIRASADKDQTLFPNQVYSPLQKSWTTGAPMPTGRVSFGLVNINDVLYSVGGYVYNGTKYVGGGASYSAIGPVTPTAVNEQYTPIGYVAPIPSPSPTSAPSPTQTPATSPTIPEFPSWIILPVAAATAILAARILKGKKQGLTR